MPISPAGSSVTRSTISPLPWISAARAATAWVDDDGGVAAVEGDEGHRPILARDRRRTDPASGVWNSDPMTAGARPVRAPRGLELSLPRLAAGGRLPDAPEQPRPRGRRASRRPRRVRRHRPGGPVVGGVRRHAAHAAHARPTTRRCSSSRASRSACSAPTSGRRGC